MCVCHVTRHFLLGKGFFAWCEKHGRLSIKTGKPSKSGHFSVESGDAIVAAAKHSPESFR